MADFQEAYDILYTHEGDYANDPDDYGGETYKGVSRRYQTTWKGWTIIDELKRKHEEGFISYLATNEDLQEAVHDIYRKRFWNKFWGDRITEQIVATEMFDVAVNLGVNRSVRFMQKALNALSKDGRLWSRLKKDGRFGPKTFNSLQECLSNDDAGYLVRCINLYQGNHYLHQTEKRPSQSKFLRGWLKRVDIDKDYMN
jgi:lysozyme family protein